MTELGIRRLRPVARIAPSDRAAFATHERAGLPVVLDGAARDWPATRRWTAAYLTDLIGAVEIDYKLSPTDRHPDFRAATLAEAFARRRGTVAELLVAITSGPDAERARRLFTGDERFVLRRRAGATTIDPALAPLLDDVVIPAEIPPDRLYTIWAWLSGRGVRTWLHYDNNGCHNLNAQLTGTKDCVLVDPDQLGALAPFSLGGANPAHNCSRLDVFDPATAVDVDGLSARLAPGDLLFIPAWWSHAFAHTGELNANVNFWWKPERPATSITAERQALVDAAVAAGVATDPDAAALLQRLDRAILSRPP